MSGYNEVPHRRFYRNKDRGMIAGVCAGVADYFGFNLKVARLIAVIALLAGGPAVLLIYFATVFLIPAAADPSTRSSVDDDFRRAVRSSPAQTMSDVKRRFQSLDSRLARLERHVTSPKFDLDRQIRSL